VNIIFPPPLYPLPPRGGEVFLILPIILLLLQEPFCGHEVTLPVVLHPFITLSQEDRLDWTGLLTKTTEDTSRGIQLIVERIPFTFFIFCGLNIDALRRTDSHTESTGHTFGLSPFILLKILNPPPTRSWRDLLFWILGCDRSGEEST
jgi:hypothetical protein